MKSWKKAVLGLVGAAVVSLSAAVGVQQYRANANLEALCEKNGINFHEIKGKDLRQGLLERGLIYEPKPFWELSAEPRCLLKLVGQEGNVLIGTSYGNPFLVGINGIGLHEAGGFTTDDAKRAIVDEFPIWYNSMLLHGPCEDQKNDVDRILLCNFFKDHTCTADDRSQRLLEELKKLVVIHEQQHLDDVLSGITKRISRVEMEKRAYLKGIMMSPMGFLLLETNDSTTKYLAKKVYEIFDFYKYRKNGSNRGRSLGISNRVEVVKLPHDLVQEHIKEYVANVYGETW